MKFLVKIIRQINSNKNSFIELRWLFFFVCLISLAAQQVPSGFPRATPPPSLEFLDPEISTHRIMVKLVPQNYMGSIVGSDEVLTDEIIQLKIKALSNVISLQHHFPKDSVTPVGSVIQNPKGETIPKPDLARWLRIEVQEGTDILSKIREIKKIYGVEIVEPDYLRRTTALPSSSSDPLFSQQWHLDAAKIPQAWAHLQSQGLNPGGDRNIVVAVIDTGVDLNHQDLAANLWTNIQDGSHGFNAINNTNNPQDDHGHGTHVAGIIAAQAGNKLGGVGVAYNVQIMPIKSAQYSGVLSSSDIASGIYFAIQKGADIINMSFGGYGKSTLEEDALAIAFGQAILVASAGNDGIPNEGNSLIARPMYPAAYNWVLGVMASQQTPNSKGDYLASFSNWDSVPNTLVEYELMAPGTQILSSIPNNNHAAWSGTSMAAPVVSGIAALVRTKFSDKNIYSSRFIMGQIATTGSLVQGLTLQSGDALSYRQADAINALTVTPKPQLRFQQYWIFDLASLSASNNSNGRANAGEIIDIGLQIRSQWGKASNVEVKIEPLAVGASSTDPYVTMISSSVNYGSVGAFTSIENGLIKDNNGAIVGVSAPFRFSTLASTPNGHIIPFRVTITARNGFDPADSTLYSSTSYFYVTVVNGEELPRIFETNKTLSKDKLWIISDQVLIPEGVTVTVTEGTKLQFYSTESRSPLAGDPQPRILVRGTLNIIGTLSEPVEITLATGYEGRPVEIHRDTSSSDGSSMLGIANLTYTLVANPSLRISTADHCEFRGNGRLDSYTTINGLFTYFAYRHFVHATSVSKSKFKSVGHAEWVGQYNHPITHMFTFNSYIAQDTGIAQGNANITTTITESLFENSVFNGAFYATNSSLADFKNNVLLNSTRKSGDQSLARSALFFESSPMTSDPSYNHHFSNNAILEPFINLTPSTWMTFRIIQKYDYDISRNFWGATSSYIDALIQDFNDDVFKGKLIYNPVLSAPSSSTYPFVVSVTVKNAKDQEVDTLGAESGSVVVAFNRDMNTSIQPNVFFGPAEPYTDYRIIGNWVNAREWRGAFSISSVTGDGYQYLRISGAQAANDAWLVTGNDAGRFRFKIVTAGTNAMSLQATGGEGKVDLTWTQNDFDVLAGYQLYRATSSSGTYSRINTTIIPSSTLSYRDVNVTPGQPYFYKFTIVKTDLTESQSSNIASATPLDTVLPVITHAPLTSAPPGLPVSIKATITDNVGVTSALLYYRSIGTTSYASIPMVLTTGSLYSATLSGSLIGVPGFEYYISATDGINTITAGRAEYPYQVVVIDKPVITSLSPSQGPSTGGTFVTIAGSNFKSGARVTFGGAAASSITVVSSSQITCVTPVQLPSVVDVIVTNPNNATSILVSAFTFLSGSASLSVPSQTAAQNSILTLPINAAELNGLVAADLTLTFNGSVLKSQGVKTGSLTNGWTVTSNGQIPGQIRISLVSSAGAISGSGVLAQLEFEVIGAPGSSSMLTLSGVTLNAGSIPVSTASGTVSVAVAYSISGAVRHWKSNTNVGDVYLETVADKIYSSLTGANGAYSILNLPPGNYTVRPNKSSQDQGISAYDASLILQHATGSITLAGSQAIAADVDNSGSINSMDAYYVLQKAAGLISLPFNGSGSVWKFSPNTRSYSNLGSNQTGQDFLAILVGDVSGNWTTQESSLGAPSNFKAIEGSPASDRTLTSIVAVNPTTENLYSLDTTLLYDSSKGSIISIAPIGSATNWTLTTNTNTPGVIQVAMASSAPIMSEGNMISIKFNLLGTHQDVSLRTQGVLLNGNSTGNFTLEDVSRVSKFINGENTPSTSDIAKYDVGPMQNGSPVPDGKIDIGDLVIILRAALGIGL